jgi:hypothetical protein
MTAEEQPIARSFDPFNRHDLDTVESVPIPILQHSKEPDANFYLDGRRRSRLATEFFGTP